MFGRLLPVVSLLVLALALGVPSAGAAVVPEQLTAPVTDNYKARWNANPSVRELRTWLSMDSIVADGTAWAPARPAAISFSAGQTLDVAAADGRTGRVTLRIVRGDVGLHVLRSDPEGRWGPLLEVRHGARVGQPVVVALALASGGTPLAEGVLEYRHEAAFAGVRPDHWEYNGPGGRWFAAGVGIRTDWEPRPTVTPVLGTGAPVATNVTPPRITRIIVPVSTRSRLVPLRVLGRAGGVDRITHVRIAVGRGARFGAWVRIAPRYQLRLAARDATWLVRVQVRDAAGRTSIVRAARVRCICG